MKVTIKRSKRRSITLKLLDSNNAIVSVPTKMPKSDIEKFVTEHLKWLKTGAQKMQVQDKQVSEYLTSSNLLIWGQKVFAHQNEQNEIVFNDNPMDSIVVDTKVMKEYRRQTQLMLENEFYDCLTKASQDCKALKFSVMKRSWGSCNNKKEIKLNRKLIMLPQDLAQYIIYHEISHLKNMNHSTKFWKAVEVFVPDCKEKRNMLKEHAFALNPNIKI